MAIFPQFVLTDKGRDMLADSLSGKKLEFVYYSVGSGSTPTIGWESLTTLINEEVRFDIVDRNRKGWQFFINGTLDNSEINIPVQFNLSECGVWATIDGSIPYLFTYSHAGANTSPVAASGSPQPYISEFPMYMEISPEANVTAIIKIVNFKTIPINILITDWDDSTEYPDYKYKADIILDIQAIEYSANIIFNPSSVLTANKAGMMSAGDTFDNYVRIYSQVKPSVNLAGVCIIIKEEN